MSRFRYTRPRMLGRLLPVVVACVASLGCGGDGNRVSGKVTFQGKPVPAGRIYFTPDSAKGNSGPTGYADIKDGVYDTSSTGGKGAASGPMIVAIEGLDPSASGKVAKDDTSGEEIVKTLFARYETTLEVSGNTTKDFDVPADAAREPKLREGPPIITP